MSDKIPNTITKEIILKSSLTRVWQAISDARQFGLWFGMRFDNPPFETGKAMTGVITPTTVNDEIAAMQKPHEGTPIHIVIVDIVPEKTFQIRWHPYAVDKTKDYISEPMTLITFAVRPVKDGVHLTITEEGFDNIPLERRAEAFRANDGGWAAQTGLIEAYLAL